MAFDSTCLSAAWRSGKQKVTIAVLFNTGPRTRAGVSVEEVAHEKPLAHLGCRVGWSVAGERERESGAAAIQRRTNASALVCCPPKGCFTRNSKLANIPSCASTLSSAFFLLGSAPATRARLQSATCVHVPEHQPSPEVLTHAVTYVVAYEWNHGGQRASQSVVSLTISMPCHGHAMLLESAVSLLIAPY